VKRGERTVAARSEGQTFCGEAATDDSPAAAEGGPRNSVITQPRAESASHEYGCLSFTPGLPIEDVSDVSFASSALDQLLRNILGLHRRLF
jgi:hypothetical protein